MRILNTLFYLSLPVIIFFIGMVFDKLIKKRSTSKFIQMALIIALMSFVIGFRSLSVGNDTFSYYSYYEGMKGLTFNEALAKAQFEKGYIVITNLFSNMRIPFLAFNFLVSVALSVFLVLSCFQLSKYPTLSIAIYVCSGCFTLNMSSVRQTLAMALCFASIFILSLLKDKSYLVKLIALIPWLFAMFIHRSSALFIIAFACMFIRPKKISNIIYFLLASILVILFIPSIATQIIFSNIKATQTYSFFPPRATLSFSGTALMLFIIIVAFFVFYTNDGIRFDLSLERFRVLRKINGCMLVNDSKYFDDQISVGMVFFQYLMYLGEQSISLLARAGLYGGLGMCIFVPNTVYKISKHERVNPVFFFSILLFFLAYFWFTTLKDNYLNLMPFGVF